MIPVIPEFPVASRPIAHDDVLVESAGPSFGAVAVRLHLDAGAGADGALAGVASLAVDMLERGTRQRTRFAFHEALERLGASLSLDTHRHSTTIQVVVLEPLLGPTLDLIAEMVIAPLDDLRELREVKAENDEEDVAELETPSGVAGRMLSPRLWPGQWYGAPIGGWRRTRTPLRRAQLAARRATLFGARMVVGVAADAPERLRPTVLAFHERLRAAWPRRQDPPLRRPAARFGVISAAAFPQAEQGALLLASMAPPPSSPWWQAVLVSNDAFASGFISPLVRTVRAAEGLSYGVSSSILPNPDWSLQIVSMQPESGRLAYAARLTLACWDRFVDEGVTEEYLDRVKALRTGEQLARLETCRQRLSAAMGLITTGRRVEDLWEGPRRVVALDAATVSEATAHWGFRRTSPAILAVLRDGARDPGWRGELPGWSVERVDVGGLL